MKHADNIQERPYQLFLNQIQVSKASGKSTAEITALANCMKSIGCNLTLPVVRPITDELYEVITHAEVVEAAKLAGLDEVWVFITTQQPSEIIEHCELIANPTPDGSDEPTPQAKSYDPARAQELKNAITEGESIIRSKSNFGKKYSREELAQVQRCVDSSKEKLAALTGEIVIPSVVTPKKQVDRRKTMVVDCGCTVHSAKKYRHDEWHVCANCGKTICSSHVWKYVDGNNASVTKYSPILCEDCFSQKHPSDHFAIKEGARQRKIDATHRAVSSLIREEITADDVNFTDSDWEAWVAEIEQSFDAAMETERTQMQCDEWDEIANEVLHDTLLEFLRQEGKLTPEMTASIPVKARPTPPFQLLQAKVPKKAKKQSKKKFRNTTKTLFDLPKPTTGELVKQKQPIRLNVKPAKLFQGV